MDVLDKLKESYPESFVSIFLICYFRTQPALAKAGAEAGLRISLKSPAGAILSLFSLAS